MPKLILPKADLERLIEERRHLGLDRHDEVWNGTYVMSPIANNEHQELAGAICTAFTVCLGTDFPARVFPGLNISDSSDDWTHNYRCPDVCVILPRNTAEDRETHWLGGPDLVVEIVSSGDRSRRKFGFYAKVGVRELLLVDRYPWQIELYRLEGRDFVPVGVSSLEQPALLASTVLPLTLQLRPGERRPRIEVVSTERDQSWLA